MTDRLLRAAEVADMLGTSPASLANMRHRGVGPRFIKEGGLLRYRSSDIETWIERNTHDPNQRQPA